MDIKMPSSVEFILEELEKNGYPTYIVGGCVRDSLMGEEPHDWDICTAALPEETKEIFKQFPIIETGIKHGTITIVIEKEHYEVTTFRIDGDYSDGRRPDEVKFTDNIKEDLERRDFTINAIAYNPKRGLIDPFFGALDIKNEFIRTVGSADKRFQEDGLRILRALRFSSQLGFSIDLMTAMSMDDNKKLLQKVSKERITSEFNKILTGFDVHTVLTRYSNIIAEFIPEIKFMIGFNQHNSYHLYDVYKHSVVAIYNSKNDIYVRLALFFHDIGKPYCFSIDDEGIGHFYGHAIKSEELTRNILKRLKYDSNTIDIVCDLIKYHDSNFADSTKNVKKLLNKIGEEKLRLLLRVRKGDLLAQSKKDQELRLSELISFEQILNKIIEENQCFSLKDLAINGNDLIGIGFKTGKAIGTTLNLLLNKVINEECENDKEVLLKIVKDILE